MDTEGRKPTTADLDTMNRWLVGWGGDDRIVCRITPGDRLSVPDALNLAAWLVAITGRREEFLALLDAIEAT